ncbi:MAG: 16S rRNA (guanine(966)-N(2))-methyltransferase RsmD [bacterium]|nr:16S rRNA (guanine(966)-N(2))-methyltransferase RsmD [bacterium]
MQIIAGRFKRRKLKFPTNQSFRPTQSRAKESIFNIIQSRIEGAHFLDLCCGTGAMGLEAYSRGAASATFIDSDTKYAAHNIQTIIPEDEHPHITLISRPLPHALKQLGEKSMDIIFFDPPWDAADLYQSTLKTLFDFGILKPHGCLMVEHKRERPIRDHLPEGELAQYHYGDTELTIYYEQ